ncbi:MAG: hypothetical protein K1060chlam4_00207 [Candidatus Anoxychlamydiales bacterium]|nr:hypothetical protein [Candidatus Anoxychlamydiales bacterium]
MKEKKIKKIFKQMIGLRVRNVKQGHGSFLTMDFGEDIYPKLETNKGIKILKRGEWYLWIHMCSWRIDEKLKPIAGCEDSRNTIERALKKIENEKLMSIEILTLAYDMQIKFENEITINLFSIYTEKESEAEQWMLFTPENKVFSAGPGEIVTYEDAGATL